MRETNKDGKCVYSTRYAGFQRAGQVSTIVTLRRHRNVLFLLPIPSPTPPSSSSSQAVLNSYGTNQHSTIPPSLPQDSPINTSVNPAMIV
jgi:hypothetical protein